MKYLSEVLWADEDLELEKKIQSSLDVHVKDGWILDKLSLSGIKVVLIYKKDVVDVSKQMDEPKDDYILTEDVDDLDSTVSILRVDKKQIKKKL